MAVLLRPKYADRFVWGDPELYRWECGIHSDSYQKFAYASLQFRTFPGPQVDLRHRRKKDQP